MKVGDYVRTKRKGIFKLDDSLYYNENFKEYWFKAPTDYGDNRTTERSVIKSSPNIIKLIEENDLLKIEYYSLRYDTRVTRLFEVNFKDEKYINLANAKCEFRLIDNNWSEEDKALNPVIKSIVTKEQFEGVEYKL